MGSGARIMALNVFGAEAGALSYNTENAIRYAADNGADVINLSIGGTSASASYQAALQYAVARGVTVIAAAGNETQELGPSYFVTPGAYGASIPGMMTVGSVDSLTSKLSYFSNFSPKYVELAAPGAEDSNNFIGLLSTLPGNTYGRLQGTSMSAPVTSGAAGLAVQLLRALGYAPTPSRIEQALTSSARVVPELTSKISGGHVLDLKGLSDYIVAKYPQRASPEAGVLNKYAEYGIAPQPCF
jgi:subtilisin family serine protease